MHILPPHLVLQHLFFFGQFLSETQASEQTQPTGLGQLSEVSSEDGSSDITGSSKNNLNYINFIKIYKTFQLIMNYAFWDKNN